MILGLKETFVKRYIAERTYETEIRPEEQSEKTESCWENLWNETVERAIKTEIDTKTKLKGVGSISLRQKGINHTFPPREGQSMGTTYFYKTTNFLHHS